jgi:uroporphyrinogen decarboxylase
MKIPFSPSVYEHAAKMIDRSPWDVSRDADLMFQGHKNAYETYQHSPIVVGIDIYNLEAEAYGAKISTPSGNGIPAIHEVFYKSLDEALEITPYDPSTDGRISMVIEVGKRLANEFSDVDVRIPVAGPFSIAFNLRGITNLCEDIALHPNDVAQFLMKLSENQTAFCQAIIDAGLQVAFFESAASPPILSPKLFHDVELPALTRVMEIATEVSQSPTPCIMGGDTILILEDILSTGTSFVVCNVETNQEAFLQKTAATHPHVKVRVNMDPGIVACNEPDRIKQEIDRILSIASHHPNCLMGTGCLPYETPPENIELIREYLK